MALEMRLNKSKWWYGRIMLKGKSLVRNLGIQIEGAPPPKLSMRGDAAFEASRTRAVTALKSWQQEAKGFSASERWSQTLYERKSAATATFALTDPRFSIPLDEAGARWLALPRRRPLSERYAAQAASWARRFTNYVAEHHPVVKVMADVRPEMAEAFFEHEKARGIAPKTYNNILIFLRSCFEALRKKAGVTENPFNGIPTLEKETIYRKPFSSDELEDIAEMAKEDPFIHPIIITGMCTAMRRGDCCLLKKESVDLENRFLKVKTSKTGETVQIPIFPRLLTVLEEASDGASKSPYLFPIQAQKYKSNPGFITGRVRRVLQKAGFSGLENGANAARGVHRERRVGLRKASVRDFHSFRVSWVTLALSAGVPLEIVQKVTGHRTASIVMTHYFQPGREEFRQTLGTKLPGLLGGKSAEVTASAEAGEASPVTPANADELIEALSAMTPQSWSVVRDKLLEVLKNRG